MSILRGPIITLVTLAVASVSCAQGAREEPERTPASSHSPISSPPFASVPADADDPMMGEVPADLLADILAEAAAGSGVDPADVEVVTAEAVTWSDGSLGCPEPGKVYTMALVPGYRVVVDAGGEQLHFHADQGGGFQFCDDPQPPAATDQ